MWIRTGHSQGEGRGHDQVSVSQACSEPAALLASFGAETAVRTRAFDGGATIFFTLDVLGRFQGKPSLTMQAHPFYAGHMEFPKAADGR
jgi:hypothetical protein